MPRRKKQLAKAIKRAKRDGKIAATAQQTIPYEEMYENGVCRLGNRLYSKSIAFEDRSYAEASDDDKAVIFELYCRLVNYFGPTVGFQLSVVCYYPDMAEYRKILRIPPTGDSFDPIRKEFSDMLLSKASLCKTERSLCLTFTVEAEDVKQAASRLEQIEVDVLERFKGIGTQAHGMDGYERLLLLHHCLHLDEPQKFKFNWDSLVGTGLSSKDYIAPSSFLFKEGRYFRVGPSVGAVSFLQIQATKLYDTLLNALLNIESSQIVSIHAKALDQGAALKTVKRKLSDLDKAKIDEQKRAVRSGFDMDILPPDLVTFGKEAEKLLEDLQNMMKDVHGYNPSGAYRAHQTEAGKYHLFGERHCQRQQLQPDPAGLSTGTGICVGLAPGREPGGNPTRPYYQRNGNLSAVPFL